MEINQLLYDLRNLQYDYADCKGDHGPVLKRFSEILSRYQEHYYLWEPLTEEDRTAPKQKYSLKSEIIFIAIIAVLFVLFAFVFHSNFFTAAFFVVAAVLFASRRDNPVWGVLVGALTIAFMIVGNLLIDGTSAASYVIFTIALVLYSLAAVKSHFSGLKKKIGHKKDLQEKSAELKQIESELERGRKAMNELLPSLVSEFKAKQKEIIARSTETIDSASLALCSELPAIFWWQISPQELLEFESTLDESPDTDVSWETRWVNRSKGKEFADAGYEYSPLMQVSDSSEEYKQIYDEVKEEFFDENNGAGVFDFISRGTVTSTEVEYFQYEDYVHSDYKRFSEKMRWAGIGNNIDQAHKDGKITDEQHAYLSSAYIFASPGAYSNIDATVQKTGKKYSPVKTSTNIWVGQMLLANDDRGDGIVVVDYRSRIPHIFKNIDALEDVRITRVSGDPVYRDPMVMAKFHKVCELCR